MYYSYVEIEYVATSFSPARTDLAPLTVYALSSVILYVRDCSKGRGQQKRTWGIEMNEALERYLKNYSAVDKIDQMLLGWDLTYRSWR